MNRKNPSQPVEELESKLADSAQQAAPHLLQRLFNQTSVLWGSLLVALLFGGILTALTLPHNFADGDIISASEMNANFSSLANALPSEVYILDIKTAQNGGALNAGANTRTLTTLTNPAQVSWISNFNSTANSFLLEQGTFLIEGQCPAYGVNQHYCKVRCEPQGQEVIGSSAFSPPAGAQTSSFLRGVLTVPGGDTCTVIHTVTTANATDGGGRISGSPSETYLSLTIKKIK